MDLELLDLDRQLAVLLMQKFAELDRPLDELADLVEQMADIEERKRFRKGIAEVAVLVYTDLMIPVLRDHPELDPDKGIVLSEDDPLRYSGVGGGVGVGAQDQHSEQDEG